MVPTIISVAYRQWNAGSSRALLVALHSSTPEQPGRAGPHSPRSPRLFISLVGWTLAPILKVRSAMSCRTKRPGSEDAEVEANTAHTAPFLNEPCLLYATQSSQHTNEKSCFSLSFFFYFKIAWRKRGGRFG
jgi:hypothetical protein